MFLEVFLEVLKEVLEVLKEVLEVLKEVFLEDIYFIKNKYQKKYQK